MHKKQLLFTYLKGIDGVEERWANDASVKKGLADEIASNVLASGGARCPPKAYARLEIAFALFVYQNSRKLMSCC